MILLWIIHTGVVGNTCVHQHQYLVDLGFNLKRCSLQIGICLTGRMLQILCDASVSHGKSHASCASMCWSFHWGFHDRLLCYFLLFMLNNFIRIWLAYPWVTLVATISNNFFPAPQLGPQLQLENFLIGSAPTLERRNTCNNENCLNCYRYFVN